MSVNFSSVLIQNQTIIVGFSGGPDSVYLLTHLSKIQKQLNLTIIAAHLDHEWRSNSAADALWCKNFCQNLENIVFKTEKASTFTIEKKYQGSTEAIGRALRRTFFQKLSEKYQASWILLGHHGDDQLETFFIRLARGSSIAGISGMKAVDGKYFRPLLNITKQDILEFLHDQNIEYLVDSTNDNPKFLRNNIRLSIIPALKQTDPRFIKNSLRCMQQLQKTEDFLKQTTLQTIQIISNPEKINQYSIASFLNLHEIIQHRIILELCIHHKMNFVPSTALFQEIIRFLHNTKQKAHQITTRTTLVKHKNYFSFKS